VVARYGGEEFAVILPEIDLKGARLMAEKVRGMIEGTRFVFEARHIPVTISIGVAEMNSAVQSADDLIKVADARLYRAKEGGRNRVVAD
jgi:two-component system cell cycle response regulator